MLSRLEPVIPVLYILVLVFLIRANQTAGSAEAVLDESFGETQCEQLSLKGGNEFLGERKADSIERGTQSVGGDGCTRSMLNIEEYPATN